MSLSNPQLSGIPSDLQQIEAALGSKKFTAILKETAQSNQAAMKAVGEKSTQKQSLSKKAKKEGLVVAPIEKYTRPLNCFIAYRCFYRNLFGSLKGIKVQQKKISGFITILWQVDPFKSKWSILARAYSEIRDAQGKKNSPLDGFLDITGPLVGIVPPQDYFSVLGWQMGHDNDGEIHLTRNDKIDIKALDRELLTTNFSVTDIVTACCYNGYVIGKEPTKVDSQSTLAMASVANKNGFKKPLSTPALQKKTMDTMTIDHDGEVGGAQQFDEIYAPEDVEDESFTAVDGQYHTQGNLNLAGIGPVDGVFTTTPSYDPKIALGNESFTAVDGQYHTQGSLNLAGIGPVDGVFTTTPSYDPKIALGNETYAVDPNFEVESFYHDDSQLPYFDPYIGNPFNTFDISSFSNPNHDYYITMDSFMFPFA